LLVGQGHRDSLTYLSAAARPRTGLSSRPDGRGRARWVIARSGYPVLLVKLIGIDRAVHSTRGHHRARWIGAAGFSAAWPVWMFRGTVITFMPIRCAPSRAGQGRRKRARSAGTRPPRRHAGQYPSAAATVPGTGRVPGRPCRWRSRRGPRGGRSPALA
jgi:hypothetical protein